MKKFLSGFAVLVLLTCVIIAAQRKPAENTPVAKKATVTCSDGDSSATGKSCCMPSKAATMRSANAKPAETGK